MRSTLSKALMVLLVLGLVVPALASPSPTSAVVRTRVFNDYPDSVATFSNNYPSSLWIQDSHSPDAHDNWANLHTWRFSEDGFNPVSFMNGDAFSFSAEMEITMSGQDIAGEAGIQISPWWSPENGDGRINVRPGDGEVACFGGVMPFYSFTSQHGVVYAGGTIGLGMTYDPNSNSELDPATVVYTVTYGGNTYNSPPLAFGAPNPNDPPPHNTQGWGIHDGAQVGGFLQAFNGHEDGTIRATWGSIAYVPEPSALVLLGLAGLALVQRKR